MKEKKRWAKKRRDLMQTYQYKFLYLNENPVNAAPTHEGTDVVVK